MSSAKYTQMQKDYYNDRNIPLSHVVGNTQWHENFPYESLLLCKYGDMRKPVVNGVWGKRALDFGCGPGRMIGRLQGIFKTIDGCDLSPRLLEEAKRQNPASNFYVSNGVDAGEAPDNSYDFIYSTICMQHIAVRSIRLSILKSLANKLNDTGVITVQMGFTKQISKQDSEIHASYMEDKTSTTATNGSCDVMITSEDLPMLKDDFNTYFRNTNFWFFDCSLAWDNLDGATHPKYWATHWIFINAQKKLG